MGESCRYRGRYVRVLNRNGWEVVERIGLSGIVSVIAITREEELLLVEQYRPPVSARVVELPSGAAGDLYPEGLQEAAARELLEETGYSSSDWKEIFCGPTSPGLTSEVVTLFMACNLKQEEPTAKLPDEAIELHKVPMSAVRKWLTTKRMLNCLVDYKVLAALHYLQQ